MGAGERSSRWLGVVLTGVLLAGGWYVFGQVAQLEGPREERLHLVLEGQHYRVPVARLPELRARSGLWFRQGVALGGARAERHLADGMDSLFRPVEQRVPDFLDWYYSLVGEYTRLGGWALEKLGFEGREMVVSRTDELLFDATDFHRRLEALEHRLVADVRHAAERRRDGWRRMMSEALREYQVPPPLERSSDRTGGRRVDLDVLDDGLAAGEQARLENRLALSSAGGVATGALVWRAATRAAARTGGRAVAARGAGRVASRTGSAALAGLGLCGATGPLALGCGVVAGTAAWVSIDWALIEADEWANREDLERRIRQGLAEVRDGLERRLSREMEERLGELSREHRIRVRRTLTPMDTIKKAATQGGGQTEHG